MHTHNETVELTGDIAALINNSKLPGYIAVEGPIGVGKTTLTDHLASALGYQPLHEPVTDNPFLDEFYRNGRNALATQLYFLLHRTRQVQNIQTNDLLGTRIVADFLLDKDRLFAKMTLDDEEYQLYQQISATLNVQAPEPDLVIYLQAPTEVLLARIRARGLDFEQQIEPKYLEALIESYTEFFHFYDDAPLLIVNAAEIDFAHNREHFEALLRRILEVDGMRQFFNPNPTLL